MILLGPNIIIITIVNNILSSIQFFSNFFLGQVDIHWTPTNKHGARGQSDHDSTNLGSENHSGICHTDHFDGDNNAEDDNDQNHHHSTNLSSKNQYFFYFSHFNITMTVATESRLSTSFSKIISNITLVHNHKYRCANYNHHQHVPPLPYGKKLAIQSWNYMGSVKIALVFTRYCCLICDMGTVKCWSCRYIIDVPGHSGLSQTKPQLSGVLNK